VASKALEATQTGRKIKPLHIVDPVSAAGFRIDLTFISTFIVHALVRHVELEVSEIGEGGQPGNLQLVAGGVELVRESMHRGMVFIVPRHISTIQPKKSSSTLRCII
jgi:hypothetical protein